jgi:hypothetical protein
MNSSDWHVMAIPPIDDFEGLTPLSVYLSPQVSSDTAADPKRLEYRLGQLRRRLDWVDHALDALERADGEVRWEGDFRHEPYVGALPWPPGEAFYLVVKQENNGTCFVISQGSPVPPRPGGNTYTHVVVPGQPAS